MTIIEVREYCEQVANEFGFNISCYPIIENKRLKTTLGQVRYKVVNNKHFIKSIEFSMQHLKTATREEIQHTILHELAHAFVLLETGEGHGHDATFKAMCKRLGLENEKSFAKIEYKEGYRPAAKYDLYCTCCGKKVGERHRTCKVVQKPEMFAASCCNAPLRCVQNW